MVMRLMQRLRTFTTGSLNMMSPFRCFCQDCSYPCQYTAPRPILQAGQKKETGPGPSSQLCLSVSNLNRGRSGVLVAHQQAAQFGVEAAQRAALDDLDRRVGPDGLDHQLQAAGRPRVLAVRELHPARATGPVPQ